MKIKAIMRRLGLYLTFLLFFLLPHLSQCQQVIGTVKAQGNDGILSLAVISAADATSNGQGVVKIALENGVVGAAWLVPTSDPEASEVRIRTPYGTKAWKFVIPGSLYIWAYGDTLDDIARSVIFTNDGGLALAGYSDSYTADDDDMLLLKLSENGLTEWANTYGWWTGDWSYSLKQTSDNGYMIFGAIYNFQNDYDRLFVKTNSSGAPDWTIIWGDTTADVGYALIQDSDEGYVCTGYSTAGTMAGKNVSIHKLDASGEFGVWGWVKGGDGDDVGLAVVKNNLGGYAIAGQTNSFGAGSTDMYFFKVAADGTPQPGWAFGGTGWDGAYGLVQANDNGFVLAGCTNSFGNGLYDFYVKKVDNDINPVWSYSYGYDQSEIGYAITMTNDQGFVVVGTTSSFGQQYDFWIIKIDDTGQFQWGKAIGGSQDDRAYSVTEGADGSIYTAGITYSVGEGERDVLLIKTHADGSNCLVSVNGKGFDAVNSNPPDGISVIDCSNVQQFAVTSDLIFADNAISIKTTEENIGSKAPGAKDITVTPITPVITVICD